LRPLWIGLAVLMLVTPLGLLATASAWGEWAPGNLKNPDTRQQIAAASGNVVPPSAVPAGLEKLSSLWTAPMPDYAPGFLKSEKLGYICSAMFGVGLILTACLFLGALIRLLSIPPSPREPSVP
jgi:cobalt/nickel transport system permease protein